MKIINMVLVLIGTALAGLAQEVTPDKLSGIMRLEDNKIINYTYLNNPEGGMVIYYFRVLPDAQKYKNDLKVNSLPLQSVSRIEFVPETIEEMQFLNASCKECKITKAKVFYRGKDESASDILYLAFDRFEWKSDIMKGFEGLRVMETRFMEEITINFNK